MRPDIQAERGVQLNIPNPEKTNNHDGPPETDLEQSIGLNSYVVQGDKRIEAELFTPKPLGNENRVSRSS